MANYPSDKSLGYYRSSLRDAEGKAEISGPPDMPDREGRPLAGPEGGAIIAQRFIAGEAAELTIRPGGTAEHHIANLGVSHGPFIAGDTGPRPCLPPAAADE
jgi:hypothetical protein